MNLIAGSRVLNTLAVVTADSLVCRPLVALSRQLHAGWQQLGRAGHSPSHATRAAESGMPSVVESSVLAALAIVFVERVDRATTSSSAVRLARSALATWTQAPHVHRIRLVGVFASTAILTHLLLLPLVPSRVRPAMPWFVWATLGAVAMLLLVWPETVARAREARRRR
jgi:hypothetical protein